jgi:hypothetical protein
MNLGLGEIIVIIMVVVILCIIVFKRYFFHKIPQVTCDTKGLSKLRNVCENIVCTKDSGWKCLDNVRNQCNSADIISCPQGSYPECTGREWQCVSTCDPAQSNIVCPSGSQVVCINGNWECSSTGCNEDEQPDCTGGTNAMCMNGEWVCGNVCDPFNVPECSISGTYSVCDGGDWRCVSDVCDSSNIPNCPASGTYPVCDTGDWKCGSVCDASDTPDCERWEKLMCVNGGWKCIGENAPVGALKPFERICDLETKPSCEHAVCINGAWKCLKNKEGGCDLSQKIECLDENEVPVCINGNWICAQEYVRGKYDNRSNVLTTTLNIDYILDTGGDLSPKTMQPNNMIPNGDFQSVAQPPLDAFNSQNYWVPIFIKETSLPKGSIYNFGFGSNIITASYNFIEDVNYTQFTYFEQFNPNPIISIDVSWENIYFPSSLSSTKNRYFLFMFDASDDDSSSGTSYGNVLYYALLFEGTLDNFSQNISISSNNFQMIREENYNPEPKPSGRKVGFALAADVLDKDPDNGKITLTTLNVNFPISYFKIISPMG